MTAIDAPSSASSSTSFAWISRRAPPALGVMARTVPSSSTMPVNIRPPTSGDGWGLVLEAHVGADPGDVDQPPAGRVGDAGGAGEVERGATVAPEQRRRDVGDEPVDETVLDQRRR